ncbi:hypothetical protein HYU07_00485 [Candidatus Woesearchaeota archaeon]|nr:hypothetical protein [Candidatus Woesearchaeota archaeon]
MGDDAIHDKCGVGLLKLLKDASYYEENYLIKTLVSMLVKSENRGKDSGGVTIVNPDAAPCSEWMYTIVSEGSTIDLKKILDSEEYDACKDGKAAIVHRRYTTAATTCGVNAQPMGRDHPRPTKRLAIAWNGNFSNNQEHIKRILDLGHRLKTNSDTERILSDLVFGLKEEHDRLEKSGESFNGLDIAGIVSKASFNWDGAFTLEGILGNGDVFIATDPHNIRPACYAVTDKIIAAASESVALTSACGISPEEINFLGPAEILVIRNNGRYEIKQYAEPKKKAHCMFEFIYFSRPNSFIWGKEVYQVRKNFGRPLAGQIYEKVKDHDANDIVVISVPNTARPAAKGVVDELENLFGKKINYEEGLIKDDAIGRTFIEDETTREDSVKMKFDPVYSVLRDKVVVVIEDSSVRGTTLETTVIVRIKSAKPKAIHIGLSCPQPRHPCCYGIDMSTYSKYIAFEAAIELLNENGSGNKLEELYQEAKKQAGNERPKNLVNHIYNLFPVELISERIAKRLGVSSVTYQTIDGLVEAVGLGDNLCLACLNGDYPTDGGARAANQGFIDYMEGKKKRSHE